MPSLQRDDAATPIGDDFRTRLSTATGGDLLNVATEMQKQLSVFEADLVSTKKQLARKERELENASLLVGQQKDLIKAGLAQGGGDMRDAFQAVSDLLSGSQPKSSIANVNLVPSGIVTKICDMKNDHSNILQLANQRILSIHSTVQSVMSECFNQLSLSTTSAKSTTSELLKALSSDTDQLYSSASDQKTVLSDASTGLCRILSVTPKPSFLSSLQSCIDALEGKGSVSHHHKTKVYQKCVDVFGTLSVEDILVEINLLRDGSETGIDLTIANQLLAVVNKLTPSSGSKLDLSTPTEIVSHCSARISAYQSKDKNKAKLGSSVELFKLLSKLAPADASKLQQRLHTSSQDLDTESMLRAIGIHVDNLLQQQGNISKSDTLSRKMSHISGMLLELLGEPETEGGFDKIEKHILTLNGKYQSTRDQFHIYQSEAGIAIQQLQNGISMISKRCGVSPVDLSSILSDPRSPEFDRKFDTMDREVNRIISIIDQSPPRQRPPRTTSFDQPLCSSREAKIVHSLSTALSIDEDQIDSIEAGVQSLCRVNHSLKHQLDEAQLNLHRYISRIQNIVQVHDSRMPSERHVHVGDLNGSGMIATPGLDDLEALIRLLIKKGGSIVQNKDELMDSIDLDLRSILPHVESLIGVPKLTSGASSILIPELPDDQLVNSQARLSVTIARWKRVVEYHSQTLINGLGPGEKVLITTMQHIVARLRSSLPKDLVQRNIHKSESFDIDESFESLTNTESLHSVSDAVALLDCYSNLVSEWSQKVTTEQQHVIATLDTLCCSLPDFDKQHKIDKSSPGLGSNLLAASQKATAGVTSLTAKYSGAHTRLQRVATTVMNAASMIDKILPNNTSGQASRSGLSTSLSRRSEDIPEHVLQESITKLKQRVAVLSQSEVFERSADKGFQVSDAVLTRVAADQLRELASSAPSGTHISELVSCIGMRIAAADSDRNLQRREGERSRSMWRKLHDEVNRRLRPLLESENLSTSIPDSDPSHAVGVIAKIEQKFLVIQRQLNSCTAELSSQKTRRLDLDSRVRGNSKVNTKIYKEITKMCSELQITAIPTLHDEMDAPATLQVISREMSSLLVTTEQVTTLREDLAKRLNDAELERARSARLEMQRLHLLNSVRSILHTLEMLPDTSLENDGASDADWAAICSGVAELSSELSIGYDARKRVSSVEETLQILLNKISADIDHVNSPGHGSPLPKRSPPPPPSSPSTTIKKSSSRNRSEGLALTQSQMATLCDKISLEFEAVRTVAQQEPIWKRKVADAENAMFLISETFQIGRSRSQETLEDVASVIRDKYEQLQEVSASNAAEKTKIIKHNLELKQELSRLDEELIDLRHELATQDEDKSILERKLEAASMFVKYAKEMKRDAEDDSSFRGGSKPQERSLLDDDDIYEFKEITAVKAYQSYLQLRKDRENLIDKVSELEKDVENTHLHEDFFGGLHAKLSVLKSSMLESTSVMFDGEDRYPARSPPQPPNGTDPSQLPTDILSYISTLERMVNTLKFEGKGLLQNIQTVFNSLKEWSGGAIRTPDSNCNTVSEGVKSIISCLQHIIEESNKRDRERELIQGQREHAMEMREKDVAMMAQSVPSVPLPPPPAVRSGNGGDDENDIERIMLSLLSKLQDIVGKSPTAGGDICSLANQLDNLAGVAVSELRYLVRRILPGQSLLDALKTRMGNPTSPARAMASSEAIVSEGVRGVANQLTTLASSMLIRLYFYCV